MNKLNQSSWRFKLHEIIYEADTPAGKLFDVALMVIVLLSVIVVILDSVAEYNQQFGNLFRILEWVFTVIFTIEYICRIICINKPLTYIFSFYGIIDLLATLPTYISLLVEGPQYLLIVRLLRMMRVFRVLKLSRYLGEANTLWVALKGARIKITVFIMFVGIIVVIIGTLMFLIEGGKNGYNNIPESIYWAIVTLSTVGYGDIAPHTALGKVLASVLMILGYGVIAVPTGIVSLELNQAESKKKISTQSCISCSREGHAIDAIYCKYCGDEINPSS